MSYMESYGFVYVLTDGEAFKVGETSGCPVARVNNLQCGNPRSLRLLRVYEACDRKAVERHLHEYLQPWRCDGGSEWFSCTEAEIDGAAEDLGSLFGAVDVGPIELPKLPAGELRRRVLDWWVNGDTLTLCLEDGGSDSHDLNFTLRSGNGTSENHGLALIRRLGVLLGIKGPTVDAVLRELRLLTTRLHWREEVYVTYRRKKSKWIGLNDFELLSVSRKVLRERAGA